MAALVQAKILGLPGLEAGLGGVLIFFPDTCEIGVFSVAAGLGKDVIDWKMPTGGSFGKPYEHGAQAGVSGSLEAATMSGPAPADAISFKGDFHTLQANAPVLIGEAIVPLSGGLYFGDKDAAGRRWGGGTLGLNLWGPAMGGGTLDWNYKLHKVVNLTTSAGSLGTCACYALTTQIPPLPDLP